MTLFSRLSLLGCALATIGSFGCAELAPVKTTLPIATLTAPDQATHDEVTMGVEAITPSNWKRFGNLVLSLSWREADRNAPVAIGSGMTSGAKSQVARTADVPLLPLPVFRVRVANSTKGALSFAGAQAQLSDGTHSYPMMARVDVMGRVTADIQSAHQEIASNPAELDAVRGAITQASIVDDRLSVAAGQQWDGYLVFKTDAHSDDEVNQLLLAGASFQVTISNLTVNGKAIAPFVFALPQKPTDTAATCPGDVKKPSLEKCKLDTPAKS